MNLQNKLALPGVAAAGMLSVLSLISSTASAASGSKLCSSPTCQSALTSLNANLSAEVAAAGRAGTAILLKQANDGRYTNSKVNGEIAAVHGNANTEKWLLITAKRLPTGTVEVRSLRVLKAKTGAAARAEVDSMALQLSDPKRPDSQSLAIAVDNLLKLLPKAPKSVSEGELPKILGGSNLVAIVGMGGGNKPLLSHFAVVPDVIDVRVKGDGSATASSYAAPVINNSTTTTPGVAVTPAPILPAAPLPPAGTAVASGSAAVGAKTEAKEEKLRGQVISSKPGETIILMSDEQGRPRNLRFDIDPALIEESQKANGKK